MSVGLIALLTFVGVLMLVVAPYYLLVLRVDTAEQQMLRQRIRTGGSGTRVKRQGGLLKDDERLSVVAPLDRWLGGDSGLATRLRDAIQLSNVKVTPGQVVFASGSLALLVYLIVFLKSGSSVAGAVAGLVAGYVPYRVLRFLRQRRLDKFEEQFPEAVDLVARSLRAGHAFTTGLGIAAEELPQPVATEFRLLFEQQNYGLPLNDALRDLARRMPLIDTKFFVTAVLTQREAGGNLAEVLDNLGAVIRERFKIKRQLRVLTAHGRITGWVLAGLPPVLAIYMFIQRRAYMQILFDDPTGRQMLLGSIVLQFAGAFLIYKISDVEY